MENKDRTNEGAKKVMWEEGGRNTHEIKERNKGGEELKQRFPNCALWWPTVALDISKYYFSPNLCVLFFQMATKILGQIVIKLNKDRHQVGLSLFNYEDDAWSNKHKLLSLHLTT